MGTDFFRILDDSERDEFIQWARDNFKPNEKPSPVWHPVVRGEWARLQEEHDLWHAAREGDARW